MQKFLTEISSSDLNLLCYDISRFVLVLLHLTTVTSYYVYFFAYDT